MKGLKVFERVALPLAIGVVAISAFFVYQSAGSWQAAHQNAKLGRIILADNQSLLSAIKDAETGQRGFLITGRDAYLDPYHRSLATYSRHSQRTQNQSHNASKRRACVAKLKSPSKISSPNLTSTIRSAEQ